MAVNNQAESMWKLKISQAEQDVATVEKRMAKAKLATATAHEAEMRAIKALDMVRSTAPLLHTTTTTPMFLLEMALMGCRAVPPHVVTGRPRTASPVSSPSPSRGR